MVDARASEGYVAERAEEMAREEERAGPGRAGQERRGGEEGWAAAEKRERAAGVPRSSGRAHRVRGSRRPHRPAA